MAIPRPLLAIRIEHDLVTGTQPSVRLAIDVVEARRLLRGVQSKNATWTVMSRGGLLGAHRH